MIYCKKCGGEVTHSRWARICKNCMSESSKFNSRNIMINPLDDSKKIGSYEEIRAKANKIRGSEVFPDKRTLYPA